MTSDSRQVVPLPARQASRRPHRLADPVIEDLLARIVRNDFPAGAALPPELELASSFGVSRTVIREAVKSLEDKGVVRARQGLGTTVCPPDSWNLLDPAVLGASVKNDKSLQIQAQLADVRVALEGQMAAQAAAQADDEQIEALRAVLARLANQMNDPKAYLDVDFEFHGMIMAIAGNRLARNIVRTLHEHVRSTLQWFPARNGELALTQAEHEAIFEAIAQQDTAAARTAMAQHISNAWIRRSHQLAAAADEVFATKGR